MAEFFLFTGVIWGSVTAGFFARRGIRRPEPLATRILKLNLIIFAVYILLISGWQLDLGRLGAEGVLMPVIGMISSSACFLFSLWMGKRLRLKTPLLGAFVAVASVSNVGATFGIPACYILFGLEGQALAGAYVLYHQMFVFVVLATLASSLQAKDAGESLSARKLVLEFFSDPYRVTPIGAFMTGFVLQAFFGTEGTPRAMLAANEVALYLSLLSAFFAVGLLLNVGHAMTKRRLLALLCGIKFVLCPAVGLAAALAFGYDGTALAVAVFESAAPVAVMSVVLCAIYGLDSEFASAGLVLTTLVANVIFAVLLAIL